MKLLGLLAACALCAAPVKTYFPSTFAGMVRVQLASDPFYGSKLLHELEVRLRVVTTYRAPEAVKAHLEKIVGEVASAKAELESGTLSAEKAAALVTANALARPDQFREMLDLLEDVKPGLGQRSAEIMGKADGRGDARLLAALHAAGRRLPRPTSGIYGPDGTLTALFDGSAVKVYDTDVAVPAQDVTPYRRPTGLKKRP